MFFYLPKDTSFYSINLKCKYSKILLNNDDKSFGFFCTTPWKIKCEPKIELNDQIVKLRCYFQLCMYIDHSTHPLPRPYNCMQLKLNGFSTDCNYWVSWSEFVVSCVWVTCFIYACLSYSISLFTYMLYLTWITKRRRQNIYSLYRVELLLARS